MKAEMRNVLDRLQTKFEGFQSIIVFPNGRALAMYRWGSYPFRNLEELEKFAYPENTQSQEQA